jgi:Cu(I)/Ag(I) efflux system membrane fusion protein
MVKVGIKTDTQVEITEGLDVGDEVVLSGQFLIDSESNLQASFQRMSQ